ncbi:MAG: hypothetical protein LBS32_06845 [Clostridiales Family XIII bacterium]|jgi:hypothetical protein|nr:hypothetical protein [Clostridiales Family XIII bacterium]
MADTDSRYILDYDAYISARPDEDAAPWAEHCKKLMKDADARVYDFIMQYIFQ